MHKTTPSPNGLKYCIDEQCFRLHLQAVHHIASTRYIQDCNSISHPTVYLLCTTQMHTNPQPFHTHIYIYSTSVGSSASETNSKFTL